MAVETQAGKDTTSSTTPAPKHTYNLQSRRKPPSALTSQAIVNDMSRTLETMAIEANEGGASSPKHRQGKNPKQSSQRVSKSDDAAQSGDEGKVLLQSAQNISCWTSVHAVDMA